jgi:hypothetical protein
MGMDEETQRIFNRNLRRNLEAAREEIQRMFDATNNNDDLPPGIEPRCDDVVWCTRAEFAEQFGIWPCPDTIGTCFVSPDGRHIVKEFIFTDEPYKPAQFLSRKALKDIAELERLYKL